MAQLKSRVARFLTAFKLDRRGGVGILMAVAMVPLIAAVGTGIDLGRAFLVKSRLSSALDAAALAGGRNFFLPTRDEDIANFFQANFPAGFLGATVTGPTTTIDTENEQIQITASATVPTTFMQILGFEELQVSEFAEITRQLIALDVVLAIDMSGSMNSAAVGGGTRIQAARNAAAILINILFGPNQSNEFLNIGLVPWNSKVNVQIEGTDFDPSETEEVAVSSFVNPVTGDSQNSVFMLNSSPVPFLRDPGPDWTGCVFQRFLDDNNNATNADTLLDPVILPGANWTAWDPIGPEGDPVPGGADCELSVNGGECGPCLNIGITPLQNEQQTILDAVDALQSPQGQTNLPQGLGWAWRVLLPSAPFTEADPNPPFQRQQALVLLTDGQNVGGNGDGYRTVFGVGNQAAPEMNQRLLELSDNIKEQDILVYVIQFANGSTALMNLLQQVATSPQAPFYNFAPDVATLENVFQQVANNLSELRLSQ